jgi:hypothetical protein
MAAHSEPGAFSGLDLAVEALEFKVTVRAEDERKVEAELRRLRVFPVRRRVYFYDTLDLDLAAQKLFLRGRVTEGDDDDSTVKLRPVPDDGVPAIWTATGGFEYEADVVGPRLAPSLKLEHMPDPGRVAQVASGDLALRKLFNKEQEAIIEAALPDGTTLDDLRVLGPIDARKWALPADVLPPFEVCVEEWSRPDAYRFLELSFKAHRFQAEQAQQAFHALLDRLGIGPEGAKNPKNNPKTLRVLEFYADWLRL